MDLEFTILTSDHSNSKIKDCIAIILYTPGCWCRKCSFLHQLIFRTLTRLLAL